MELFLHPWFMVAGGLLVSAPIIIHLINRMRFRRVRWAAMEFLLKSQKKNQKKLIIQQLILLLLRCLLVLLAAFLVARYVAASPGATAGTLHFVVLDDTPSMADRHRDSNGQETTAFDTGKKQIGELARKAIQATSEQKMRVVLLSDLDNPVFEQKLSESSIESLRQKLEDRKPGAVHYDPDLAVAKARDFFAESEKTDPNKQKVLHFVSDFREIDWGAGPAVEKLTERVDGLLEARVNLSLIDVAHPYRSETKGAAIDHGNVALLDLRAEARVAAETVPVEFTVTAKNFSSSEKKPFLKVRVNGVEDFGASRPFLPLGPSDEKTMKFQVTFVKKKPAPDVRDNDSREERDRKRLADVEFAVVTAELEGEDDGLRIDNVRDLVIAVRKRVPTLVIDGSGVEGRAPGGDSFHVEMALAAARSYEVEWRKVEDLETINLDVYPSVYLLNVPRLRSDKALAKLDDYVKRGGSLAYFLGEKVQPDYYNDILFKKSGGLFPLRIAPRPSEPLTADERDDRKQRDEQPKILFREEFKDHPAVATLYKSRSVYRYLLIDQYWPAQSRASWDPDKEAQELIVLPNRKSLDEYKARAQDLGRQAKERTDELAAANPAFAKYVPVVQRAYLEIRDALGKQYLFNLVTALDNLLNDPGVVGKDDRPSMPELWAQGRMTSLKAEIEAFRDAVQYGDPLVVSRPHGKGRVTACLSSAGTNSRWNEWGSGGPVSWSYLVFLMDLQRYLTSEGDDLNKLVGETATLAFDAARYKPEYRSSFQAQVDENAVVEEGKAGVRPPAKEERGLLKLQDETLTLTLNNAVRPGVYMLEFTPLGAGAQETGVETRAYAFNVDAVREGDLKRAAKEKLERNRPGTSQDKRAAKVTLRSPGDSFEDFRNRTPDASESPWLYLLFLVVLVVEQALAVHLSFHLKGDQAAAAPAAA